MTTSPSRHLGPMARKLVLILAFLGLTFAGSVGVAPAAQAAGTSYNNTDPYATGCNSGASLIHTYYVGGGKFDMFYSGTCQTNWVQWTGPNVCTWKRVQSDYGTWTRWEKDQATWSYSMQIYAPGTTSVDVEFAVGSAGYGGGTCGGGAWDYAQHGGYTI